LSHNPSVLPPPRVPDEEFKIKITKNQDKEVLPPSCAPDEELKIKITKEEVLQRHFAK